MKRIICLFIGIKLSVTVGFLNAQVPLNDNCSFAMVVVVPDDGDTCIHGSNLNASADGLFNTCDSLTAIPLPPGGNEVWYTYIATGTNNTITVTPSGAQPAQFLSLTVPSGNCSNSAFLACNNAIVAGGTANITTTFTAGTQVWFSVTSLAVDGEFDICVSSYTPPPVPAPGIGTDCSNAIPICDKHTFVSPGPVFNNATGPISCYAFGPQNVLWYKFTAGTNDSLIWLATPNPGYELDWSLNDITLGCPGVPVACNFATTGGGGAPTGMVSGSVNPCGAISQICTPVVLTAGNTYALHFNIENFLNVGIDTPAIKIEWGGSFKMAPYAGFTVNIPSGCDSLTTTFTNNSVSATSYQWDFGNGQISVLANPPPQFYGNPGTYVVSLTVNNSGNCASVTSMPVTVYPSPSALFDVSDTILCLGSFDTVNYALPADPNHSYNWNFSGASVISGVPGSAGPYVLSWNSFGIKTVELSVTDNLSGCTSLLHTRNISIVNLPDSTFSLPATACEGEIFSVNYTGVALPGAFYNWNFGSATVTSGSGPGPYNISFSTSGTFNVSLSVNFSGCISDDSNSVTVSPVPVSNAGADQFVCSGEPVQLGVLPNPLYFYSWSPTAGLSDSLLADPVFSYINISNSPDTFVLILNTSVGACFDNDTVQVIVQKKITSSFTLSDDTLCGNESATIAYTGNALPGSTYQWGFAGGNTINTGGQGYLISWSNATNDSLSLFIIEGGCSSDTTYIPFVTGDLPVAAAGADKVICSGQPDTLGGTPVAGVFYSWSPASGLSNSAISDPVISLLNNQVNNDTLLYFLQATTGYCTAYDTVEVIIKPIQKVVISGPATACINNTSIQFVNSSLQVSGSSFLWDFENANPSSSASYLPPPVQFTATGPNVIRLEAFTAGCGSEIDSFEITVYHVPVPGFLASPLQGCPPLTVDFTDTTTSPAGSTYLWDFGNGDTSTAQHPSYNYVTSGQYDVTLTVITPDTCAATITYIGAVTVFDLPVPLFSANPPVTSILEPQILFTSESVNTDSCIFFFGDGSTSFLCGDYHSYQDTGSFLVQLIAISSKGCSDTLEKTIRILPFETFYVPNAFTPNNDGRNDVLVFTGSPVPELHVEIYNRWGQMVFVSDDLNAGWDGTDLKTGAEVSEGVYVYRILYRDLSGKKHSKQGNITLVR